VRKSGGFSRSSVILCRVRSELGALLSRNGRGTWLQQGCSREAEVRADGAGRKPGGFLEELRYPGSCGDANGGPCYRGADVGTGFNKVL
jgi:hypothetical protein